jgi:dipeptidyl aminopeptidase/acylaminoacyl peptidase
MLLQGCGAGAGKPSAPAAPLAVAAAAQRGDLAQAIPQRIYSLTPETLHIQLKSFDYFGDRVRGLAGAPVCGVDLYDFKYNTVGAADEPATASGAIMVPTGSDPACTGKRPLVLYGHGNTLRRKATMATLEVGTELGATAIAAASFYAARGYIVVAPNYVGYDTSSLDYHPHHLASQQGKEMIDALLAARKALPSLHGAPAENGKLFLTGHSEGGYATMAAHRAMQAAGRHLRHRAGTIRRAWRSNSCWRLASRWTLPNRCQPKTSCAIS